MRALALAASASGMLPSRTYICESAVQARRSVGRRVMAWSPQPMASLRLPVFKSEPFQVNAHEFEKKKID
jgi:hypothetical protein